MRRGHGDLHLGNIALIDGRPVPFDALEFDPLVAAGDVLYDLAFLLMDLTERGLQQAANTVLNRYLAETQRISDLDALAALPLFMSVRAAIRAKVTAARLDAAPDKRDALTKAARTYFGLACSLIDPPPPRVVAVGGLSGTGKSVLARALASYVPPAPGAVHLRSDVERKVLFGAAETERLPAEAYSAQAGARVYAALYDKARHILVAGHSVDRRCGLRTARGAYASSRRSRPRRAYASTGCFSSPISPRDLRASAAAATMRPTPKQTSSRSSNTMSSEKSTGPKLTRRARRTIRWQAPGPRSNRPRELRLSMNQGFRRAAVGIPGFCAFLNLYGPQSLLPLLAQEFAATPADISLTMTATALAIAISAPFAGAIADVLGRKRVIAAAMLLLAIPTAMIAFAPSLPALVFWRFAQGLVLPPIFTVVVAYIGEEWPPAQATGVTALYMAATSAGGFSGRFFSGLLADTIGWRNGFIAFAAVTLVCGVVVAGDPAARAQLRALRRPRGVRRAACCCIFAIRTLLATYAVGFGTLFNFVALFTYVNFVLAAPPFSLPPTLLGAIFATYLAGSLVLLWLGRAIARYGRRPFIICVLAVWACGAALTLVPSLWTIIGGLTIAAACGFLTQATSTAFVAVTAAGAAAPPRSGSMRRASTSAAALARPCRDWPGTPAAGPPASRW